MYVRPKLTFVSFYFCFFVPFPYHNAVLKLKCTFCICPTFAVKTAKIFRIQNVGALYEVDATG